LDLLQGLLLCFLSCVFSGAAQPVLAPPPTEFSQTNLVTLPLSGTNQLATNEVGLTTLVPTSSQRLLDFGPIHIHPHPFYRFSYGNGIQAQPGQQTKTAVNEFSPGVLIELGTHWRLDYTPTLRFYSSSRFKDGTDHSVALNGGTSYQDWRLGLSQAYSSSSQPLVETGGQTDQENYSTSVSAGYQINNAMSLEVGVSQNLRFVGASVATEQLSDSRDWSTMEWLSYHAWSKFSLGLGVGGGYTDVQVGSDMTYEQLQGRIQWQPGEKLTFSLNGGFEDRQFLDSRVPNVVNPIFGCAVSYHLFDQTTISLNASRTVSASYFARQVTESTSIGVGIRQRFFGKLFFDIGAGYGTTSYGATETGETVSRGDTYENATFRLGFAFLKDGTASLFYNWSHNSSSDAGFSYYSNQAGMELGYRF